MEETRGRKPKNGIKAMTAAERKAAQRVRMDEVIQTTDSSEWTEAICLHVLVGDRWRGGAMDKAAWKRLGELRKFVTVADKGVIVTNKAKASRDEKQATLPGL